MSNICARIASLLKKGFGHVFIGTFLNKGIAMISSVIVARIIDKIEYAYLSYSETLYGYLILFAGLGMSSGLLKVCSGKTTGLQDKAYLSYAAKWGAGFEALITICLIIICTTVTLPFPEARFYIISTALYPAVYSIYDTLVCYIRAKQKNILFARLNVLYSLLTCVFSIILVLWINAIGIVIARYLVLICIGAIALFSIKNSFTTQDCSTISKSEKRSFWIMSLSLMAANIFSGMMPFNENLLISNLIADEVTTANFRVASLFPQLLLLVSQALMIYFFPIVSEMDNHGADTVTIKKYIIKIGILNFVLVIFSLLIGIVLTPFLISFFYTQKYADAIPIAYLLWIMRGINAAIRIVPMNMLIAVRAYKFNLIMSAFSAFIQLLLDWYFIKHFGIVGVAYGTIAVYLISGIIYWVFLLNRLKTNKTLL